MTVTAQVLFDRPQQEIASLIANRMSRSVATSIVTGFATPGGLGAIAGPILRNPNNLATLVIGAATYPGFEALDCLIGAGVSTVRLHVHLGHTALSGGRRNPFVRYHPMLHSKVYYMELPGSRACAFIGSHNVTSFALTGMNGEAAVLLEGPKDDPEFQRVRNHITIAESQAVTYSSAMKEAYAWWMREYVDGLKSETGLPQDWSVARTILVFAEVQRGNMLAAGDHLYFEIPSGIEQIESLKTETHVFLFDRLPGNPWEALRRTRSAAARFICKTLGVENQQGNLEVSANWRVDTTPRPALQPVPSRVLRPKTPAGMQQVRAEVESRSLPEYEYLFELERTGWDPVLSDEDVLHPAAELEHVDQLLPGGTGDRQRGPWKLVTSLVPREGHARERDAEALLRAAPDSGSFILVSLRRRRLGENAR